MLRQSDGYLSGQQLCDHFQVSRTAVWKAINQLKEEGYEIEAVRNKGYRIVDIPDRITADAIKSCLETKWMAKNLEYYDEIEICPESHVAHFKAAMQIRNRSMVDRSDLVICYIEHNSSGAYQTMQYALKQEKEIINLAGESQDENI